MAFISRKGGGDLTDIYITEIELVDRFVGKQLWAWGYNGNGQLGDETVVSKSSPVQTVTGGTNWKQVASGGYHTLAIKFDGTLWTWGYNGYGALGDGTTVNKSSPVQTISGGTNWKQVASGHWHTSAIKTDGSLWTWGRNIYGILGDGTAANKSSPVQTVAGGTDWSQVSCGYRHTAAIKSDGTLWTWGWDGYGALGDGTTVNKSSPVQTICGGTDWSQVSCGYRHTSAIKTDGSLWTWGYNANGQLGDGTIVDKSSPVQTVAGGTDWKSVSNGGYHTVAIKTDGTLWTWGSNGNGQLGDGTVVSKSSPVQTISGGTNWKQVSSGLQFSTAIKTDGTLWTWGSNSNAQLGDGTVVSKSSPVQTVTGGTNWKQVSCEKVHTMAITIE